MINLDSIAKRKQQKRQWKMTIYSRSSLHNINNRGFRIWKNKRID